jgi:hypothetical protein
MFEKFPLATMGEFHSFSISGATMPLRRFYIVGGDADKGKYNSGYSPIV